MTTYFKKKQQMTCNFNIQVSIISIDPSFLYIRLLAHLFLKIA